MLVWPTLTVHEVLQSPPSSTFMPASIFLPKNRLRVKVTNYKLSFDKLEPVRICWFSLPQLWYVPKRASGLGFGERMTSFWAWRVKSEAVESIRTRWRKERRTRTLDVFRSVSTNIEPDEPIVTVYPNDTANGRVIGQCFLYVRNCSIGWGWSNVSPERNGLKSMHIGSLRSSVAVMLAGGRKRRCVLRAHLHGHLLWCKID